MCLGTAALITSSLRTVIGLGYGSIVKCSFLWQSKSAVWELAALQWQLKSHRLLFQHYNYIERHSRSVKTLPM